MSKVVVFQITKKTDVTYWFVVAIGVFFINLRIVIRIGIVVRIAPVIILFFISNAPSFQKYFPFQPTKNIKMSAMNFATTANEMRFKLTLPETAVADANWFHQE